jgi:hypothetical protein
MNHIAKRRGLDEKNVGHGVIAELIYRSLSMTAITMPSHGAIGMRFLECGFYDDWYIEPVWRGHVI